MRAKSAGTSDVAFACSERFVARRLKTAMADPVNGHGTVGLSHLGAAAMRQGSPPNANVRAANWLQMRKRVNDDR